MKDIDSVKSPSSPNGSVRSRSNSRSRSSSRSPSPPDKERSARKYTQSILDAIKIPQKSKSKNTDLITKVLDILLNNMKENEEFKRMVNRLYHTGSAYNDLKITSATEYDINLILKVPKCVTLTVSI